MNATRRDLPRGLMDETIPYVPQNQESPAPHGDPASSEVQSMPAPTPRSPHRFTFHSGARPLEGYTIRRAIGRGGFGEVYYATSDAGKEVALKLLTRHIDIERRGVTHCMNLKSPNLITIYDLRTNDEGDTFVVMEYVSGPSLAQILAEHPDGLPPHEVRRWLKGLVEGVTYLHEHGIVHRDLKPANLFLEHGVVKIGDYGLSKSLNHSNDAGMSENVGTCYYMAPEISSGKYHKPIDIYAIGIILFEMITGRVPFEGESTGEVLMKHLTAHPDLTPVAEPYRSLIKQALAKVPAHRQARALDLLPPEDAPHAPEIRIIDRDGTVPEPASAPTRVEPKDEVLVIGHEEPVFYIGPETMPPHRGRPQVRRASLTQRLWGCRRRTQAQPAARRNPPPRPVRRPSAAPPLPSEPPPIPSGRVRVAELASSMLWAAPFAALASSITLASFEPLGINLPQNPPQLAFLFIMMLLGTWAVLIPEKLWETRQVRWGARRLAMVLVGLALGALGVALANWTRLSDAPVWMNEGAYPAELVRWSSHADLPKLTAGVGFAGFMAILYGVLSWTKVTARDRWARFRFLPVIKAGLAAGVLGAFIPGSQGWCVLLIVMITILAQVVSPWSRESAAYSFAHRKTRGGQRAAA